MSDLGAWAWCALAAAALIVGLSKTAVPGAGTLAVALFAAVLPAKQSTGALLILLIVADVFAVTMYRRHADWRALWRLAPAVGVGIVAGAVFMAFADDAWMKRTIGVILLAVIAITLWRRRVAAGAATRGASSREDAAPASEDAAARRMDAAPGRMDAAPGRERAAPQRFAAAAYGSLGGFTTMVANAAGPVMSMYFLASRFEVKAFLGTAAWFFAIVNVAKVPFSVAIGIITPQSLMLDLMLVPVVVVGAFLGRWVADRIDQRVFERLVIGFTVVGAVYLLVS